MIAIASATLAFAGAFLGNMIFLEALPAKPELFGSSFAI